ncbi:DUF6396 domain-containing protein [Variovorax humicola]|uniref:DUF6396 domain-containing protein n=1 Tax=Variovorax humicola TaxID=1769758 RepID=A0ABU8VZE3_9BURK
MGYGFQGQDQPMVGKLKDRARAERYSALGDALERNPDLLLPNLDKVLPLPPAQLPKWDGNEQALIDAAKGLVPATIIQPTPGTNRTGRAHIPDGYVLPSKPVPLPEEDAGRPLAYLDVPAQAETTAARFTGYWLAQLLEPREFENDGWDRAQVPQRYARGEAFARDRAAMGLSPSHGRIMWHYLGLPEKRPAPGIHPRIAQGVARASRIPEPWVTCTGNVPCPKTGIWRADVGKDHPHARVYNHWAQQAYVEKGQPFPSPRDRHLDICSASRSAAVPSSTAPSTPGSSSPASSAAARSPGATGWH